MISTLGIVLNIKQVATVDHTAAPLDGNCLGCGGNDHWTAECPLKEVQEGDRVGVLQASSKSGE